MNKQCATLSFEAFLTDIVHVNSSFDGALLSIAYHGDNHNGVHISKESFEKAIPTMFNCPVVCRYIREENNLGGHDVEIVKDDDTYRLVNITEPVGVVPESAEWFWKNVTENDGKVHEYLCTHVVLWKRQEAYTYIKEHGIVGHSMEVNVYESYKRSDGFKVYQTIEFTAFCLLGDGVQPCFESASLKTFEQDNMRAQMHEMMNEFKQAFSTVTTASADDTKQDTLVKGGEQEMNLDELMAKFGLSAEDVNFDTEGMTEQEIESRFALIAEEKNASEDNPADAPAEQDEAGAQQNDETNEQSEADAFSLTANQVFDSLWETFSEITYVDTRWGETCVLYRYFVMDFSLETNEVIVWDDMDGLTYGFAFVMNGDHAEIDFESKKRKKMIYADYDEGSASFTCENPFGKMKDPIYKAFSKLEGEASELRAFKANTEKAAADAKRKSEVDAVFARFEELKDNEMFMALCSNYGEMTIEEIEDRCFAIKGRMAQSAQFSMAGNDPASVRIPTDVYADMFSKSKDEPYGGVFAEFGIGQQ